MRMYHAFAFAACTLIAAWGTMYQGCSTEKPKLEVDPVARGKYLIALAGCNDCHTPKAFTSVGTVFDESKLFSGHPASAPLPVVEPAYIERENIALTNRHQTAWFGQWGVSFATNLTPDAETGIGSWTEDGFVKSLRTGKHFGTGRSILPPMPWFGLAQGTDEDLKAMFAYLKSLKPISNRVPAPIPFQALKSVQ